MTPLSDVVGGQQRGGDGSAGLLGPAAVTRRRTRPDPEPGRPADAAVSTYAYAYAGNEPATLTDPSGRCPWYISVGVGALVEGGAYALTTDDFSWAELAQATGQGAAIGPAAGELMPGAGNAAARILCTAEHRALAWLQMTLPTQD
ncbi:hypothetical protein [Streptomyces sp. NBC_01803]|uniref:hypothetical protein n=1 Tax=Streptomyces sp. NBC_01803 TaxID=2975946 RepID=UPI002DD86D6C|nr:hypothetical protein [Streptomyces sp. NBC_01803]WSA42759.1 hypothetical protein OIE51_00165 [Streptomyces sp. NBC_01803]